MRKMVTCLFAAALCLTFASAAFASTALRISQVYGGNGTGAGQWNQDFIELFNSSGSAINLTGYAIQYGSATTTTGFGTTTVLALTGTIPSCGYYLIACQTPAAGGTALPVTPDQTSTVINVSSTSGKLLLIQAAPAAVACLGNVMPEPANWLDQVGFGTGAGLCFETTAAPALTTTTTLVRGNGGMSDTDINSADFTTVTATATPPRNSSSPKNSECLITPTTSKTWGRIKVLYR